MYTLFSGRNYCACVLVFEKMAGPTTVSRVKWLTDQEKTVIVSNFEKRGWVKGTLEGKGVRSKWRWVHLDGAYRDWSFLYALIGIISHTSQSLARCGTTKVYFCRPRLVHCRLQQVTRCICGRESLRFWAHAQQALGASRALQDYVITRMRMSILSRVGRARERGWNYVQAVVNNC